MRYSPAEADRDPILTELARMQVYYKDTAKVQGGGWRPWDRDRLTHAMQPSGYCSPFQ